jgi:hypothetical protein
MVSQTPRFNLDKYSQGEDNWSHSDTVDLLDELAVETDVISNRNASGDYDDELFYATDQKLLYRWDSGQSDWLIEGGVGSSGNRLPSLWADTVNSNVTKHATDISEDYTVDSGEGAVFAGPVTGTGSISGDGQISVIQEGTTFTDNVDAQGNDINNVGSLSTDDLDNKNLGAHPENANGQTITSGQWVKITFSATDWNAGGWDSQNDKHIIQRSGKHRLALNIEFVDPPDGTRVYGAVYVNGTRVKQSPDTTGAADRTSATVFATLDLSEGDEIEFYVNQNSGTDIITTSSGNSSYAEVVMEG